MRYTEEHEWLRVDGDVVVVGITEHASEQLGDVVFCRTSRGRDRDHQG